MTKKATAEKAIDKLQETKSATDVVVVAATWNTGWNIARRLLEARRRLRGTQLWQQFELQRSFDAFSIHTLARGVEQVLCDVGVISAFAITKWQKQGNTTVVEGVMRFESVDDGTFREYATVGEGVDPDDKGLGKAISYARKVGMVSAMNLGIGIDNEATTQTSDTAAKAGPAMGGAPQQTAQTAAVSGTTNGAMAGKGNGQDPNPHANHSYTLQQTGMQARAVLGRDMVTNCWAIIQNTPTVSTLDAWGDLNHEMLEQFCIELPAEGDRLPKLYNARRAPLTGKGAL